MVQVSGVIIRDFFRELKRLSRRGMEIVRNQGLLSLLTTVVRYFTYEAFREKELDYPYAKWLKRNRIRKWKTWLHRFRVKFLRFKPVISILMPVYNTDTPWLKRAVDSVHAQVYPYWELCIADDGSTKPDVGRLLRKYAAQDPRIKTRFLSANEGISEASNAALSLASGDFIGLLDHDDELSPDALYEVARFLNRHPEADMLYSDEDKIAENGERCEPSFKPDWSPDLFLSCMYTCHFGVYRKSLVREIGEFRKGYEGSQDYDLVLRLTERTDRIFHIPRVLYHWRKSTGSAASSTNAKPYAYTSAKEALKDALHRRQIAGVVLDGR